MANQRLDTAPLGPDEKQIQRFIRAAIPRFMQENMLERYGAFGLGIGRKCAQGPISLRVYVSSKLSQDKLPVARRIPESVRIEAGPGNYIDVPTDVVERGLPSVAMLDPEDTLRPVPGGSSISIPGTGGNGTLGAWVLDKTDETIVALTNRHVSGGLSGAPVIQPGANDGGSAPADTIGFVKRTVPFLLLPANPTPADCNFVDAAIIGVNDPDLIDLSVIELGPAIYQIDTAAIGDMVQKSGQTTGYTTGVIVDADFCFSLPVPISPGNFQQVAFCDCYIIDDSPGTPLPGFLSDGDSGSALFGFSSDPDATIHPAVGLLFASTGGGGAYACKIQHVFDALDLDVLCASGYPSYLDGLAAATQPGLSAGHRFTARERSTLAATRATGGLARDVEKRLAQTERGRAVIDIVRRHRHAILMQLIRQSDLRRAVTDALSPVLRGARTSDDVLSYKIEKADLDRIKRVQGVLKRIGMKDVAKEVSDLAFARKKAVGEQLAKLLDVDRE